MNSEKWVERINSRTFQIPLILEILYHPNLLLLPLFFFFFVVSEDTTVFVLFVHIKVAPNYQICINKDFSFIV